MYLSLKTDNADKKAYLELEISLIELDLCDVIRTSTIPGIDTGESEDNQTGEWDPF